MPMAMGMDIATTCRPMGPSVRSFMSPEVDLQRFLARFRRDAREHVLLRGEVQARALEQVVDLVHVVALCASTSAPFTRAWQLWTNCVIVRLSSIEANGWK